MTSTRIGTVSTHNYLTARASASRQLRTKHTHASSQTVARDTVDDHDMPEAAASSLTYYPAYCWTASPTYNIWAKLSAADVHSLIRRPGYEGQRLYFYRNHPIRYVRLVGLVTSFDDATETTLLEGPDKIARTHKTPWAFTLDDGSGENIDVICWKDDETAELAVYPGEIIKLRFADLHEKPAKTTTGVQISLDGVEVCKVVKVKGWVDEYRGRKQILLERVQVLSDTMAEVQAWNELAEFQETVLSRAWKLSQKEVVALKERDERKRRKLAKEDRRRRAAMNSRGSDAHDTVHRSRVAPNAG